MSYELLQKAGAHVEFKTYMGLRHSVNPAELSDMVDFAVERLKD
jgi:predicted esterase